MCGTWVRDAQGAAEAGSTGTGGGSGFDCRQINSTASFFREFNRRTVRERERERLRGRERDDASTSRAGNRDEDEDEDEAAGHLLRCCDHQLWS